MYFLWAPDSLCNLNMQHLHQVWEKKKIEWDIEKEVVSVFGKKPLEIVKKKKKRATDLSCASLCREATLEKRFHSSSHILGFTLLFI